MGARGDASLPNDAIRTSYTARTGGAGRPSAARSARSIPAILRHISRCATVTNLGTRPTRANWRSPGPGVLSRETTGQTGATNPMSPPRARSTTTAAAARGCPDGATGRAIHAARQPSSG